MEELFRFDRLIPFGVPPLLSLLTCLVLALFPTFIGEKRQEFRLLTAFCLLQALLHLNNVMSTVWLSPWLFEFSTRSTLPLGIFIIPVVIQLVHRLCGVTRRWLSGSAWIFSLVVMPFTFSEDYTGGIDESIYGFNMTGGWAFWLVTSVGLLITLYVAQLLWSRKRNATDPEDRSRYSFLLTGFGINGLLMSCESLNALGWNLYPLANFSFLPLGLIGYGVLWKQSHRTILEWYSQGRFSSLLVWVIWFPVLCGLGFWILTGTGIFYYDVIERFFPYSILTLVSLVCCLGLASLCTLKGVRQLDNLLFSMLCAIWGWFQLDLLLVNLVNSAEFALAVSRLDHLFFVMQPGLLLHFIYRYTGNQHKSRIYAAYVFSLTMMPLSQTSWFLKEDVALYHFGYFPQSGIAAWVLGIVLLGILLHGLVLVQRHRASLADPLKRKQSRLLQTAMIITGLLALGDLPASLGVEFYPLTNLLFIPMLVLAYAVLKTNLVPINPYSKRQFFISALRILILFALLVQILFLFWAVDPLRFTPLNFWQRLIRVDWGYLKAVTLPLGIPPLLTYFVCTGLSLVSLRVAHFRTETILFSLICWIYGLISLNNYLNLVMLHEGLLLPINQTVHLFVVLSLGLHVHFIYKLLGRSSNNSLVLAAYSISLMLVPLSQTPYYFTGMLNYSWGMIASAGVLFNAFSTVSLLTTIYLIALVVKQYMHTKEPFQKYRLFYVALGLGLTAILFLGNSATLFGYDVYPTGNFAFISILVLGYGLLRYNLSEASGLIKLLLYNLVMLLVVAWIAYFAQNLLKNSNQWVVYFFAILLFILVYNFCRRGLSSVLNVLFGKQSHQLRNEFDKLTRDLSQLHRIEEIHQLIRDTLFSALRASRFCMLLIHYEGEKRTQVKGWQSFNQNQGFFGDSQDAEKINMRLQLEPDHLLLNLAAEHHGLIDREMAADWLLKRNLAHDADDWWECADYIQPVWFEGHLISILLIGNKLEGSVYSDDERFMLHRVGMTLGPYLQNADLLQNLENKVTERTAELEDSLHQMQLKEQEIRTINQVVQTVNATLDLDQVMEVLMQVLGRFVTFDQTAIALIDHEHQRLSYYRGYGAGFHPEHLEALQEIQIPLNAQNCYMVQAVDTQKPVWLDDVKKDRLKDFSSWDMRVYYCAPYCGLLILPLVVQKETIGLLTLGHSQESLHINEGVLEKIEQFMLQIATAINNARMAEKSRNLLEATQEQEREIRHINQVLQTLNSTLDLDRSMNSVMELLKDIFQFDMILILLVDEEDREVRFLKAIGHHLSLHKLEMLQRCKISLDAVSLYVDTVVYADLHCVPRITLRQEIEFSQIDLFLHQVLEGTAYLLMPLEIHNQVIGVINFCKVKGDFNLGEINIEKVKRYVNQIATAVNNSRLYEESRRQRVLIQKAHEEINDINQVVQIVNSTLDLEEVIMRMQEAMSKVFRFDQVGLGLIDEKREFLEFKQLFGTNIKAKLNDYAEEVRVALDAYSTFTQVIRDQEPLYLSHVSQDWVSTFSEFDLKLYELNPVQAVLIFPLEYKKQSIGVISFFNTEHSFDLLEEDVRKIQRYVNQISSSIYNAGLTEKLKESLEATQTKEQEIAQLNQVMLAANASLDMKTTASTVYQALRSFLDFDQFSVHLVNYSRSHLELIYVEGTVSEVALQQANHYLIPLRQGTSVLADCVLKNKPIHLKQVEGRLISASDTDRRLHAVLGARSYLMFPLNVQNKTIGLIALGNTERELTVPEVDMQKIGRFVTQLATAIHNARLFEDLKNTKVQLAESEKVARMTQTFEKFVPKQFLKRLASQGVENIRLGEGNQDYISILFADIRDFTAFSEDLEPQELLNFLNSYFDRMNEPIRANGGFVDKFIGDAIMALFDFPEETDALEAECAVRAAIGMQVALQQYNQERSRAQYRPISSGIGIHSGQTVIGTVGSLDRMDSTVLGDSVNVAARLEGLTKYYGAKIIISFELLSHIRTLEWLQYRELDFVRVKGRGEPVLIYEVLNAEEEALRERKIQSAHYLSKGLFHRHLKEFDEAIVQFHNAMQVNPDDTALLLHIENCRKLKTQSLPENWDGALDWAWK